MPRIFIVDDDRLVRTLLKAQLQKGGYEVEAFDSAEHVSKAMDDASPDLLITDIFMPERSGLELIMETRGKHPDLKIIAISGDSQGAHEEGLAVAECLGSVKTLEKPFTNEAVLKAVEESLQQ